MKVWWRTWIRKAGFKKCGGKLKILEGRTPCPPLPNVKSIERLDRRVEVHCHIISGQKFIILPFVNN
jgi:hypothetical protein